MSKYPWPETSLPVAAVVMAGGNPKDGLILPTEGMKVVKGILDQDISPYSEMILPEVSFARDSAASNCRLDGWR